MKLKDVKQGNAFEYRPGAGKETRIGIKIGGPAIVGAAIFLPVRSYEALPGNIKVYELGLVEGYENSVKPETATDLEKTKTGMVCHITEGGLVATIVVNKATTVSGRVVATCDLSCTMSKEKEVDDKGYAGEYNSIGGKAK